MTIHSMPVNEDYERNYKNIRWERKKRSAYSGNGKRKENRSAYIIPDNYDAKSFRTADITGEDVYIESRSQERELCKRFNIIKREKGMGGYDKRLKSKPGDMQAYWRK